MVAKVNNIVTVTIEREKVVEVLLNIRRMVVSTEDFLALADIVKRSRYEVYLADLPAINGRSLG